MRPTGLVVVSSIGFVVAGSLVVTGWARSRPTLAASVERLRRIHMQIMGPHAPREPLQFLQMLVP